MSNKYLDAKAKYYVARHKFSNAENEFEKETDEFISAKEQFLLDNGWKITSRGCVKIIDHYYTKPYLSLEEAVYEEEMGHNYHI